GRTLRLVGALVALALFVYSLTQLGFNPGRLARAAENALALLGGFFPPVITMDVLGGVFESVVMALTATTFGVIIGLVIAVLSTNVLIRFAPLSFMLRAFIVLVRG